MLANSLQIYKHQNLIIWRLSFSKSICKPIVPIYGTLLELCSAKSFSQVIEKPEHKKKKRAPGKEEQKVMYNVRNGLKYYTKFNWTMVNYGNSSCIVNIRLLNLIFLFKLKNCFKRSHRYWGVTVPVIYFQIPSNEVKFSYYPSQTAASSLLGDSESIPYPAVQRSRFLYLETFRPLWQCCSGRAFLWREQCGGWNRTWRHHNIVNMYLFSKNTEKRIHLLIKGTIFHTSS